jgi:polysaccharide export outer membrane protein
MTRHSRYVFVALAAAFVWCANTVQASPQQRQSQTQGQTSTGASAPGVQPTQPVVPQPPTDPPDTPSEYQIGPEDVLSVIVWKNADLTQTVSVRPDGRISLPLVNDVLVSHLTANQLRDVLTKKYAAYVNDPEVSVVVKEINSIKVSVLGMVKTPGRLALKTRTTVLDALAMAGGLVDFAKRDRIVVFRMKPDGSYTPMGFDYTRVVSDYDAKANFLLQSGDIVVVP